MIPGPEKQGPVPGDDKETQDCRVKLLQISGSRGLRTRSRFSVEDENGQQHLHLGCSSANLKSAFQTEEKKGHSRSFLLTNLDLLRIPTIS